MKGESVARKKRNILVGALLITAIFLTGFVGFVFARKNQENNDKYIREAYMETKIESLDILNLKLSHSMIYTQNNDGNSLSEPRFTIGVRLTDIDTEGKEKPYDIRFTVSYEIVGDAKDYLTLGELAFVAVEEGENQKYDELSSSRDITSASFITKKDSDYAVRTFANVDIVRAYQIPIDFKDETIKKELLSDQSEFDTFKDACKASYISLKVN